MQKVQHSTSTIPALSWADRMKYLAGVNADGDVPTLFNTRLTSDIDPATGRPWTHTHIHVSVHYVSPISPEDTVYLVVDGADGRGRAIVIADGQDLAECEGWMYRQTVRLAGRRTELFGTVGLDIRRTTQAVAA